MAATLSYQGIRITVPVEELAEAVRQLRSLHDGHPSSPQQQALGFDLASVQQQFEKADSDEELALRFLRAISAHEVSGAPLPVVMAALGAVHPKGVGSKTAVVNRVLDSAGFAVPDVYTNPRDSYGERNWRPGIYIKDAIEALEILTKRPSADDEGTQGRE